MIRSVLCSFDTLEPPDITESVAERKEILLYNARGGANRRAKALCTAYHTG